MSKPEPKTAFDRGNRTYHVSDERLRAFGQLTPLQRLQWVEQCSHFVRLGQLALQADQPPEHPKTGDAGV